MSSPNILIALRHGESFANTDETASRRGIANATAGLTDEGWKQAEYDRAWLAANLQPLPRFGLVSPYLRPQLTGGVALPETEFTVLQDLRERDRNGWHGEQLSNDDEQSRLKQEHPLTWLPPGGESLMQAMGRLAGILDMLEEHETPHESFVISAHGEVMIGIRALMVYTAHLSKRKLLPTLPTPHLATKNLWAESHFVGGMTDKQFRTVRDRGLPNGVPFAKVDYCQVDMYANSAAISPEAARSHAMPDAGDINRQNHGLPPYTHMRTCVPGEKGLLLDTGWFALATLLQN